MSSQIKLTFWRKPLCASLNQLENMRLKKTWLVWQCKGSHTPFETKKTFFNWVLERERGEISIRGSGSKLLFSIPSQDCPSCSFSCLHRAMTSHSYVPRMSKCIMFSMTDNKTGSASNKLNQSPESESAYWAHLLSDNHEDVFPRWSHMETINSKHHFSTRT